jgi:hypothetical protein
MIGPSLYIEWINQNIGFNPRGARNSDALSRFVVDDLCSVSPKLKALIDAGDLRVIKNANVPVGESGRLVRNIDLVLAENHKSYAPVRVPLSIEHKTIMTAHGKARKNRYGDIIAYNSHMHNHRLACVVGATVIINTSDAYENPDSFAKGMERQKFKMEKIVPDTMKIFETIPLRDSETDPIELPEALSLVVVNYDGVNPASIVEDLPDKLSPCHYTNFIARLVQKFEDRFCA